jgi:polyhydroxybutyrate depolymerase
VHIQESPLKLVYPSRFANGRTLLLSVIFLCTAAAVAIFLQRPPLNATIQSRKLIVQGEPRCYRLVIPKEPVRPTPLIIAFHGIGDTPESMAAYSNLDKLAADHGIVLAYPEARRATWSTFNLSESNLESNVDIQFFDALLADIIAEHGVNASRVYVMGMSNGASFAQTLGTVRANKIAAIFAHSGARPPELAALHYSVPTILFVGAKDPIAEDMELDLDIYRRAGANVEYRCIHGLGHQWSARHNRQFWLRLSRFVLTENEATGTNQ